MTTTALPKMTAKVSQVGSTKSVQFFIYGEIGAELAAVITAAGWHVVVNTIRGDLTWYVSPVCSTPAQIEAARPASLRNLVTT